MFAFFSYMLSSRSRSRENRSQFQKLLRCRPRTAQPHCCAVRQPPNVQDIYEKETFDYKNCLGDRYSLQTTVNITRKLIAL